MNIMSTVRRVGDCEEGGCDNVFMKNLRDASYEKQHEIILN